MTSERSICVQPTADAAADAVREWLERELESVLSDQPSATLCLAGGETPLRVYDAWSRAPERVEWSRVDLLWGDERMVPEGDAASNAVAASEFVAAVPCRAAYPIPLGLDAIEAAERYEAILRALAAERPDPSRPPLDVVLLGMGADGHVASLFPNPRRPAGSEAAAGRWVHVGRAPTAPRERVTLSETALLQAGRLALLVVGETKAAALAEALSVDSRSPAGRLARHRPDARWFVDQAAWGRRSRGG